jgi:hypothetical protein
VELTKTVEKRKRTRMLSFFFPFWGKRGKAFFFSFLFSLKNFKTSSSPEEGILPNFLKKGLFSWITLLIVELIHARRTQSRFFLWKRKAPFFF